MLARFQLDAGLGEMVDVIGHHFGLAARHRLEHIAVGDEAQPLLPRSVARCEMGIDIDRSG